jgi:hypothetical protein
MDGYTAWKLHRAVSLHLTTLTYDLFEHNGRVKNTGPEFYMKTNSRKIFELIAKRLDKPHDAVEFFIACILYTRDDQVMNPMTSWDLHTKYKKHKESLTKFILDDLETIDVDRDLYSSDSIPVLLSDIVSGNVLPQTAVALDKKKPFLKEWVDSKVYFGFRPYGIKLSKMSRFVKYNEDKVNSLIEEKMSHASV